MEDWRNVGFGLYVHWPFCTSKCPYCDFNSHVAQEIDSARWQAAYLRELDRVGARTEGRVLNSIFFGGGTPSLMKPELVGSIIAKATDIWRPANDLEVTLEANPGSVEARRFRGYAEAGVNRVSLGIQALDDHDLRRLGRMHSVSEALAAIEVAQSSFSRVSIDLIYARQEQTLDAWSQELERAISLGTEHLSLYQLTIEENTVFAERFAKGLLSGLPSDDLSADLYEMTGVACEAAGLMGYEVSNHARTGAEARHNLIYWRMGDYAGVGPGAHGRLTLSGQRWATEARRAPADWIEAVGSGGGDLPWQMLSGADQATEYILMALRLKEGASLSRFHGLAGKPVDEERLCGLIDLGLMDSVGDRMVATPRGRLLLNSILETLAP
ncbi:MAG: coproporphyrinogen III oxidase [Tabrizicola sp.]|nr:coproporphyrinogen III oxidase [Tabrizicola sp.]